MTTTDAWETFVTRLVKLLEVDEELHTAFIDVLGAHAEAERARAEHEMALARKADRA